MWMGDKVTHTELECGYQGGMGIRWTISSVCQNHTMEGLGDHPFSFVYQGIWVQREEVAYKAGEDWNPGLLKPQAELFLTLPPNDMSS